MLWEAGTVLTTVLHARRCCPEPPSPVHPGHGGIPRAAGHRSQAGNVESRGSGLVGVLDALVPVHCQPRPQFS